MSNRRVYIREYFRARRHLEFMNKPKQQWSLFAQRMMPEITSNYTPEEYRRGKKLGGRPRVPPTGSTTSTTSTLSPAEHAKRVVRLLEEKETADKARRF
jgi:hypothetical protein